MTPGRTRRSLRSFRSLGSRGISGRLSLPGDKSIAHRCVILSSLCCSPVTLHNFPYNEDCCASIEVFKKLGVRFRLRPSAVSVSGNGLRGLKPCREAIKINESGTTFRLMLGVLSGQDFSTALTAGSGLSRRPMLRVTALLRRMGADIRARKEKEDEFAPVTVGAGKDGLKGMRFTTALPSAQVKSALLLAGLYARGKTAVTERTLTRDHTERMLKVFKAGVSVKGKTITVAGGRELRAPAEITIPGDISSAAFFITAACILPSSRIVIEKVGLNPTRMGMVRVLERMGGRIKVKPSKKRGGMEPSGTITVCSSRLKATVVKQDEIPSLIDELPVLMVAAACASGTTVFQGVGELRVKETDRIASMLANLKAMGVTSALIRSRGREDVAIEGVQRLEGARVRSFGDHRTAMSMVIAALKARGVTRIDDISCINKSFPGFLKELSKLRK